MEILQKFKISNVGIVAGCVVREGKVTRKSKIKVMRGDDLVFEGEIESLKRIKDEVSEVRAGTECGIRIKNFSNIEIGDILDVYETHTHSMMIGMLVIDLFNEQFHSLKEKRQLLSSLKKRLKNKFNIAVAESDYQDLWQKAQLSVVVAGSEPGHPGQHLQGRSRISFS